MENVKWWSDWDELFAEIYPDEEQEDTLHQASIPRPPSDDARTDLVIFGATGLVGMLACERMKQGAHGLTWAIAGRNEKKLQQLSDKLSGCSFFRGANRFSTPEDIEGITRIARVVLD